MKREKNPKCLKTDLKTIPISTLTYLHIQRQTSVRRMITKAATDAPTATPRTSPSTSHFSP